MDLTKLNFNDIYAEITRQFAEASSQFQQDFNRFQKRIDWQDPFIIGLYSTQVLFLILVLHMIRNRSNNGLMIFLTLSTLIVLGAESINSFGTRYWQKFARRPYFDRQGAFISAMVSIPLLIQSIIISIAMVRNAAIMMIKVKRQEFAAKKRQKAE